MPAERRFRAMGSDAHIIVVGGPARLLEDAVARVAELERRWSRFLPDSEISQLNRWAGIPVAVSADTVTLVEHAMVAWRLSGGAFDPTVLGAVIRAGYDQSFELLVRGIGGQGSGERGGGGGERGGGGTLYASRATPDASRATPGTGVDDIVVDRETVTLPAGTGFDPGGIGKGLAADLICAETLAAGADGVCVNLGGDVRVAGAGPSGGRGLGTGLGGGTGGGPGGGAGWTVAVEHPDWADPIVRLGLAEGAVATSSTRRRRWQMGDEHRHHLIDPQTGLPSDTDLTMATVVAGQAWIAEMLVKAVILAGSAHPFDIMGGTGAHALAIDERGGVHATPGLSGFLGGAVLPPRLVDAAVAHR